PLSSSRRKNATCVTSLIIRYVGAPSRPWQPGFFVASRNAAKHSAMLLPAPTGPEKPLNRAAQLTNARCEGSGSKLTRQVVTVPSPLREPTAHGLLSAASAQPALSSHAPRPSSSSN